MLTDLMLSGFPGDEQHSALHAFDMLARVSLDNSRSLEQWKRQVTPLKWSFCGSTKTFLHNMQFSKYLSLAVIKCTNNMVDTGIRGALSGVEELVTFLEIASTSDRSAFSRRANVIFECRTCASLFRKADGFMRHVMRCDGSRTGDVDSEFDRRIFLTPPIYSSTAARAPGMVPLKRPLANGVVPAPNVQSSTLQQQNLNVTKSFVKTVKVQDLSVDIRPSRMRKTPKWLEKEFVV
ncbi:unnamed protein product [Angiostrongylus costaricensis]|uniref:C2H2-type domain-containing protein n=1 Tax=Angiostrongylus costaricensis TaxID=334426 RepID=A0A0R3PZ24_ANGCS|nr:unnamed protein product [Angiostrongylus costaricensis]